MNAPLFYVNTLTVIFRVLKITRHFRMTNYLHGGYQEVGKAVYHLKHVSCDQESKGVVNTVCFSYHGTSKIGDHVTVMNEMT
jgi:hypothetical protein